MSTALGAFQQRFSAALWHGDASDTQHTDAAAGALTSQPGFTVYRNTVMKGCIDALEANYPAVARLVGSEWFRSAAALYVRAEPPRDARLQRYGEGFADFLAAFPPAAQLPYLPAVARLDRCWSESHVAADAPIAKAQWLAALAPQALGATVLRVHPAARWLWCNDMPVYSIWSRNRVDDESGGLLGDAGIRRDEDCATAGAAQAQHQPQTDARPKGGTNAESDAEPDADPDLLWQAEGALLTRPAGAVQWSPLGAGGCAFLDACAAGLPLAQAAEAALTAQADVDLAALLSQLLQRGALTLSGADAGAPTS